MASATPDSIAQRAPLLWPTMGRGALGVWHDVVADQQREIEQWYNQEHHAERVAIPGFLRARRYRNTGAGLGYFSRYDTVSPAVLASAPYLDALNQPSAWSKAVFPHYRRTVRGAFEVTARVGVADGGSLLSLRFHDEADAARDQALVAAVGRLAQEHGVVRAEAWRIDVDATSPPTSERGLRSGQDVFPRYALLIDASRIEHAVAALDAGLDADLRVGAVIESYQLVFQTFAPSP
jgi:hypothetical protein